MSILACHLGCLCTTVYKVVHQRLRWRPRWRVGGGGMMGRSGGFREEEKKKMMCEKKKTSWRKTLELGVAYTLHGEGTEGEYLVPFIKYGLQLGPCGTIFFVWP